MCDRCTQICKAITDLNSAEGSTVTIFNQNPDFHGPESRVDISRDFDGIERTYFGNSVLECLEKAVEEMKNDELRFWDEMADQSL